jgi:hypothetical protein
MENDAEAVLLEAERLGIKLRLLDGKVLARPISAVTPALVASIKASKQDLIAHLHQCERTVAQSKVLGRHQSKPPARQLASPHDSTLPPAGAPAYSLLETCRRYGVALSIDENGCLVVGRAGAKASEPTQPWPSLMMALEAHCEDVSALVKAG